MPTMPRRPARVPAKINPVTIVSPRADAPKRASITRDLGLGVASTRSSLPSFLVARPAVGQRYGESRDDHDEQREHGIEKHHVRRDVATAGEPVDDLRVHRVAPAQIGEQIVEVLLHPAE